MSKAPEYIINGKRNQFFPDWMELWANKDILRYLVKKEYLSKYKQTILGPIWYILQPLVFASVISLVFGDRMAPTEGNTSPFLFYLASMIGWNYFSGSFINIAQCLNNQAHLFRKVYFPRLIVPLSIVTSSAIPILFHLLVFLLFSGLFAILGKQDISFTVSFPFFFLPLLHIGMVSLGVGLLLSALSAKYRDFYNLTNLLVQLLFFASPVLYSIEHASAAIRWFLYLNPLSAPLETLRLCLTDVGTFHTPLYATSLVTSVLLLVAGLVVFQRTQRNFVDYV